jgi:hypothetical protein
MKTISLVRIALCCFALPALLFTSGCGGDPDPGADPDEKTKAELLTSGQWSASNVTIDGVNSQVYAGMTISFTSATGYSSNNGGVIWKSSGTYRFQGDSELVVDDDFTATITDITATSMKLSFNRTKTTLGPGRDSSVKGAYIFTFSR